MSGKLETFPRRTFEDFFSIIQQGFRKTNVLISVLLELVPATYGIFKARLTEEMSNLLHGDLLWQDMRSKEKVKQE